RLELVRVQIEILALCRSCLVSIAECLREGLHLVPRGLVRRFLWPLWLLWLWVTGGGRRRKQKRDRVAHGLLAFLVERHHRRQLMLDRGKFLFKLVRWPAFHFCHG